MSTRKNILCTSSSKSRLAIHPTKAVANAVTYGGGQPHRRCRPGRLKISPLFKVYIIYLIRRFTSFREQYVLKSKNICTLEFAATKEPIPGNRAFLRTEGPVLTI